MEFRGQAVPPSLRPLHLKEAHVTLKRKMRKTLFTGNRMEMKSSQYLEGLMSETSHPKVNPALLIFTWVLVFRLPYKLNTNTNMLIS